MTERGADRPLDESSDRRVHTKPSHRDEKEGNFQGEALSFGAIIGWDGEQKVSLIATHVSP